MGSVFGKHGSLAGIDFPGRTDPWIIRQIFARFGIEYSRENVERYVDGYIAALPGILAERDARVMPGVKEILSGAAGRPGVAHGLLTGNLRRGAKAKLDFHGLWEIFPVGAFSDDSEVRDELGPHALRRARAHWGARLPLGPRVDRRGHAPRHLVRAGDRCARPGGRDRRLEPGRTCGPPAGRGAREPRRRAGILGLGRRARICLPPPGTRESSQGPEPPLPDAPHLHDRNRIGPRRIQVQGADQGRAPRRRPQRARHGHRLGGALRLPGFHPAGRRGGGAGGVRARDRPRRLGQRRGDRRQPGTGACAAACAGPSRWPFGTGRTTTPTCLSIGQRTITADEATRIVRVWLATEFEGGRHIARIKKIDG